MGAAAQGTPRGAVAGACLLTVSALSGCGDEDGGTRHPTGLGVGAVAAGGGLPSAVASAPVPAAADGSGSGLVPIEQVPVGTAPSALPSAPVGPRPPSRVPPARAPGGGLSQLEQFQNDGARLEPLPEPAAVETTSSGLQVVYTTDAQRDAIEPAWVEAQWQHMQSCTQVQAPSPLVLVVEGMVRPITASDDVIRAIDGAGLATASTEDAGTALQVTEDDVLPDASPRGFALRAIIGRWLWQGASLPERDYPFACAAEEAPVEP